MEIKKTDPTPKIKLRHFRCNQTNSVFSYFFIYQKLEQYLKRSWEYQKRKSCVRRANNSLVFLREFIDIFRFQFVKLLLKTLQ